MREKSLEISHRNVKLVKLDQMFAKVPFILEFMIAHHTLILRFDTALEF